MRSLSVCPYPEQIECLINEEKVRRQKQRLIEVRRQANSYTKSIRNKATKAMLLQSKDIHDEYLKEKSIAVSELQMLYRNEKANVGIGYYFTREEELLGACHQEEIFHNKIVADIRGHHALKKIKQTKVLASKIAKNRKEIRRCALQAEGMRAEQARTKSISMKVKNKTNLNKPTSVVRRTTAFNVGAGFEEAIKENIQDKIDSFSERKQLPVLEFSSSPLNNDDIVLSPDTHNITLDTAGNVYDDVDYVPVRGPSAQLSSELSSGTTFNSSSSDDKFMSYTSTESDFQQISSTNSNVYEIHDTTATISSSLEQDDVSVKDTSSPFSEICRVRIGMQSSSGTIDSLSENTASSSAYSFNDRPNGVLSSSSPTLRYYIKRLLELKPMKSSDNSQVNSTLFDSPTTSILSCDNYRSSTNSSSTLSSSTSGSSRKNVRFTLDTLREISDEESMSDTISSYRSLPPCILGEFNRKKLVIEQSTQQSIEQIKEKVRQKRLNIEAALNKKDSFVGSSSIIIGGESSLHEAIDGRGRKAEDIESAIGSRSSKFMAQFEEQVATLTLPRMHSTNEHGITGLKISDETTDKSLKAKLQP